MIFKGIYKSSKTIRKNQLTNAIRFKKRSDTKATHIESKTFYTSQRHDNVTNHSGIINFYNKESNPPCISKSIEFNENVSSIDETICSKNENNYIYGIN